ncbi:MAG: hypothetical protein ACR5LG_13940, partial [Sodalis sp. (in: enterobacteria)]
MDARLFGQHHYIEVTMTIEMNIIVQQTHIGIDVNINASGTGSEVKKKEAQFIRNAFATVLSC